ncbi:hypothetical protein, partial [Brevundimonas terrae]
PTPAPKHSQTAPSLNARGFLLFVPQPQNAQNNAQKTSRHSLAHRQNASSRTIDLRMAPCRSTSLSGAAMRSAMKCRNDCAQTQKNPLPIIIDSGF